MAHKPEPSNFEPDSRFSGLKLSGAYYGMPVKLELEPGPRAGPRLSELLLAPFAAVGADSNGDMGSWGSRLEAPLLQSPGVFFTFDAP